MNKRQLEEEKKVALELLDCIMNDERKINKVYMKCKFSYDNYNL